ncbi:glycosyltransferase family 1 protein [Citricoccus sp. SGAir0253]|uniref:glycosyltransferase n=1 Tax=Citricoccus sp. SGAir0253 TaxID=2567881 RepID=UPI0010CCC845|nr:glycosyltransferase [Citricoccus sp. SGAir0253]QCU79460.1 glycosyltransferase family 1 protein [Citricoccus sp. SGAir0253]
MDARYTRTDFHDGISRYGASLIEACAPLAELTMVISDEAQLRLLPAGLPWVRTTAPTSPAEPFIARQLNPFRPDVVFSPMQTMGSAGREYGLVLTLHDLIYYRHRTPPRDLPAPVRAMWRAFHLAYWPQRLVLDRADAVATVSETTRRLMRRHRLTSREIRLVGNAPQPVASPRDPAEAPERSLVYMGSFMDYKNVEAIVRSLALLDGYRLHLLSRITPDREAELLAVAAAAGVPARSLVFHRGTSDEEYARLLRRATALVTLSRSEGYGLPVAEAMAQGTPVVLSDLEIFREIGGPDGGAARFVPLGPEGPAAGTPADPSPAALAARVAELEDPAVFAAASRAAVAQAAAFSWDDSARALVRLAAEITVRRSRARGAGGPAHPGGSPCTGHSTDGPDQPSSTSGSR